MNITREQALRIVDILFEKDIDKVAPKITLDAPKSLADMREELNDLIRRQTTTDDFTKLMGLVEQVIMHLADGPKWTFRPDAIGPVAPLPIFPTIYPPIPATIPYSPFPGGTTICSTARETSPAMCQADGHTEDSQYGSPYKPLVNDDIPF
jgi:hypothetical protein